MTRTLTDFEILGLRNQGMTLQAIGDIDGVCRERVRQIIKQEKGDTKFPDTIMTQKRLSQWLQINSQTVDFYRHKRIIHPINNGNKQLFIYSPEEVQRIKNLVTKICPNCGKVFQSFRRRFCPECRLLRPHPSQLWKFKSEKCKAGCIRASKHWKEAHPERYKKIQSKAVAKYQAKKKLERQAV